jgi:hypothetical protein
LKYVTMCTGQMMFRRCIRFNLGRGVEERK